jgi:hypothetical protein|tara:strand:- start:1640 stop:2605 length:966 start_codon:yes stop_codon:yes gene_type:complete
MKINDNITLSIAAAVSDVLEGKVKKEEADYPHDMWSPEGEKEVAKDEAEHKALAKKGYSHDKPEVDEVAEPVAKGEKDFKAKHKVKKSGEKEDGTVVKEKKTNEVLGFDKDNKHDGDDEDEKKDDEKDVKKEGNKFTMALNAARKNGDKDFVVSGKKYKVEDYDEDEDDKEEVEEGSLPPALQKAIDKKNGKKSDEEEVDEAVDKNLVKKAVALALKMSGDMTGATKKIEKMKKGLSKDKEVAAALQLANEEVSESVLDEAASMNQAEDNKAKYKAFFDKALKKFGVESPAELEGDKKKEFFDYVDKNYNSEDEPGKDGAK